MKSPVSQAIFRLTDAMQRAVDEQVKWSSTAAWTDVNLALIKLIDELLKAIEESKP